MSTFKRVLSMAVVVTMILSMIPAAFAAETPVIYMGDTAVDLTDGAATVEVPVGIAGNPGFAGMDLSIPIPEGWSIAKIAIKSTAGYSIFYGEDEYGDMEKLATPETNTNFNGVGKFVVSSGSMNFTEDGVLFWVTYNVPAKTENGKYAVEITPVKLNTLEDTTVNIADDIDFTAGTIAVTGGVEAEPVLPPAEPEEAKITVGNAKVDLTDGAATVEVPVEIKNNSGFAGMDLSISIPEGWSISKITIKSAAGYSIFYGEDEYGDMEKLATPETNTNFNGVGKFVVSSGSMNFTADGPLFWVTYNVPKTALNGAYNIDVMPVKINTLEDTTVNIADDMTFETGIISVTGGSVPEPELSPEIRMGNAAVDLTDGAATVEIPVKVTDNPGFAGMDMSISIPDGWSIAKIAIKNASDYSIFYGEDEYGDMEKLATPEVNPNFNGVGKFVVSSGSMNFAEDGYLFWVTYNVPADTEAGDYKVKVDPVKINTLEDTTVNIAENIEFTAGTITVAKETVEETGDLLVKISGVEESDFITVYLYETYPGDYIDTTKIGGNGEWTFEGLAAGTYAIEAVCAGYETGFASAMVYVGDITDVNIEMTKKETPDVPDVPVDPELPADSYLAKMNVENTEVTIINGEEAEVTVNLVGISDMMVYGIAGNWDTMEKGGNYMALSAIGSDILSFSGMNYVDVPSGHVEWTDDSFEAPGIMSVGTKLLTATYVVDGDTPEGEYTIRFFAGTLTADDFEPDERGHYYTATVTVKHHTHTFDREVARVEYLDSVATCTEAATYYKSCICGEASSNETFVYGEALGHAYHAESYVWAEDGSVCTVYGVCAHDAAHTVNIEAKVTPEVTLEPTCEEKGQTTYTASFDEEWAETQIKTLTDIDELGHDYHVICTRCKEIDPAADLNVQAIAGETYAYEKTYGVNSRVITVTNDIATKVGYLKDGAYTVIPAVFVKTNADGTETYSFAVPSADEDVGVVNDILIVVKGDINADGAFKQGDKTLMARTLLVESKPAYKALTIAEQFAADINGDGVVKQGDKTLMARALLVESKPAYKKLSWVD